MVHSHWPKNSANKKIKQKFKANKHKNTTNNNNITLING